MKLTGAAILVSRGIKVLQAAPAAYPYRSAKEGVPMGKAKKSSRTLADILHNLLPTPVRQELSDDGVILTGGDPGLVVVRVSNGGVEVSVFGIRWNGPHTPTRSDRRLCYLSWEELPEDLPEQAVVVQALIQAALVARRAKFRMCRYCQRSMPPEWQHSGDVCQGCAEKHLGVVH
jgi:hypothetical protein